MNHALLFLGVPMLFYAAQSADYLWVKGRIGMAVAFVGYTIGNIGLLLDSYGI